MIYNNKHVTTLSNKFSEDNLVKAYQKLMQICPLDEREGQICLTHRPNAIDKWYDGNGSYFARNDDGTLDLSNQEIFEEDFTEFNEEAKHTYFYEIYKELSEDFVIGRMRILGIPFKKGLSWHRDMECRIHIPIITSPSAFMIFEDTDNMITEDVPSYNTYHLPIGNTYFANVLGWHTAFNGGRETRINLLLDVVSVKNENITIPPGCDDIVNIKELIEQNLSLL